MFSLPYEFLGLISFEVVVFYGYEYEYVFVYYPYDPSVAFVSSNILLFLQSDDDCCNNCEEVREAYRKKGWALSNPDSIDQVCLPCLIFYHF